VRWRARYIIIMRMMDTTANVSTPGGTDTVTPLTITFATAREISGLGLTTLWGLARDRRIETVRVGRRTLITYRSLARLLLPEQTDESRRARRGRPRKAPARKGTS
jgi:hypothetical protein